MTQEATPEDGHETGGTGSETAAVRPEPATSRLELEETEVGSVFVSNYPPFSQWDAKHLPEYRDALGSEDHRDVPLGLYMHIPFCRKRCKFCYFRVYTDKNADEVQRYCDALATEIERYAGQPSVTGRPLKFVYFGGGTPSFIAAKHLEAFVERASAAMSWANADEVTFECEPGTLSESKLEAIRRIGVTRLSVGVENFDDDILELNGRAHVSTEIYRVEPWIRALDFDQVNIDLISGMIGESWETWRDTVQRTIDYDPDSVTIYQMELPYNTRFTKQYFEGQLDAPLADWKQKREWHQYAFEQLAAAGYELSSAYTMVKSGQRCRFVYRDSLWHGADMLGTGVSSFGHMSGVHVQNTADWIRYLEDVDAGELPVERAYPTSPDDRLTRETILQLKTGHLDPAYFEDKFGVDIRERFREAFATLEEQGMLTVGEEAVELTRPGLLQVDTLLPEFYAPRHRDARYT